MASPLQGNIAVIIALIILAAAVSTAAWQFVIAIRIDPASVIVGLKDRFERDIQRRAQTGQHPDWSLVELTCDRRFSTLDEEFRSVAAACLTFGVFFTLLSLIILGVLNGADFSNHLQDALIALGGNAVLIAVGLVIQRWVAPNKLTAAEAALEKLREELYQIAEWSVPRVSTREQDVEIFTEAVGNALSGLPNLMEQLVGSFTDAQKIQLEHRKQLSKLTTKLEEAASRMAEAVGVLAPLNTTLGTLNVELIKFPTALSENLAKSHENFAAPITLAITKLAEVDKTLRDFDGAFKAALSTFKDEVSTAIETSGRKFGHEFAGRFSTEAATQLSIISGQLTSQSQALQHSLQGMHAAHLGQVQQYAQNNHSVVVQAAAASFTQIGAMIAQQLATDLADVSRDMRRAASIMQQETSAQLEVLRVGLDAYRLELGGETDAAFEDVRP